MEHRVANRDVLAIGTSAGGFEALRFLASEFPHDFPASVLAESSTFPANSARRSMKS